MPETAQQAADRQQRDRLRREPLAALPTLTGQLTADKIKGIESIPPEEWKAAEEPQHAV